MQSRVQEKEFDLNKPMECNVVYLNWPMFFQVHFQKVVEIMSLATGKRQMSYSSEKDEKTTRRTIGWSEEVIG